MAIDEAVCSDEEAVMCQRMAIDEAGCPVCSGEEVVMCQRMAIDEAVCSGEWL